MVVSNSTLFVPAALPMNAAISVRADFVDTPEESDEITLVEFAEVNRANLYVEINALGITADADNFIGQGSWCKVFEFQILAGGFNPQPDYPGILLRESDTGRVTSEEAFGRRDSFKIELKQISEANWIEFEKAFDFLKGGLYPFYAIFNNDDAEPIVHRLRMDGAPRVNYEKGNSLPWSVTLPVREDV